MFKQRLYTDIDIVRFFINGVKTKLLLHKHPLFYFRFFYFAKEKILIRTFFFVFFLQSETIEAISLYYMEINFR